MKSHELRERLQKFVAVYRAGLNGWLETRPSLLKGLRWSIGRSSWGLVVVVVTVVLVDLFLGQYRLVGPWVFGITSGVVGLVAGRWAARTRILDPQPESGEGGRPGAEAGGQVTPAARGLLAVGAVICFLLGIQALSEPTKLGIPEFESLNWSAPPDRSRPHIFWQRVRGHQTTTAPVALFFGGLIGGFAILGWSPPRSANSDRRGRTPGAAHVEVIGPHPGVLVLIVWLLLLLVVVRVAFTAELVQKIRSP